MSNWANLFGGWLSDYDYLVLLFLRQAIFQKLLKIWSWNFASKYTVSKKKQSKLFSSELRQISINFDNFWQKDGQDDEIMWGALIFHLT